MAAADAIVVGAGPNGLSAAVAIARAGRSVTVYEAQTEIGGGCRTEELTLPGFHHDVCSAVHPMGVVSPFWRTLPLGEYGLEWVEPPAMLAHPFDEARAAVAVKSVAQTALNLGVDEGNYRRIVGTMVDAWPLLADTILAPPGIPSHPLAAARVALMSLQSMQRLTRQFHGARARALLGGVAGHSMLPLDALPTGPIGLVLIALTHVGGWLFPRGGARRVTDALGSYLRSLGGEIVTGTRISSLEELPPSKVVLCDLSPRPFLAIADRRLPERYKEQLRRYRYGPAAYKVDWALDGPIPWRDDAVARAGTVHLGGTFEEIAASERDAWDGRTSERPFVLLVQPTLFDSTRAPEGKHIAWTYCHVPNGSTEDMLPRIEAQIERFAPGFRDRVLARSIMTPADLERRNPNLVGGDIAMGVCDVPQMIARPTLRWYATPARGLYLCSASTPPGVGVHGMCGYFAAQLALRRELRD
jgi:phytoene dehydrogenase-like protein